MAIVLTIAVCLFPGVTALDFVGPMELLGFLTPEVTALKILPTEPPYHFKTTYLSVSKDLVRASPGFDILPAKTYDEATEQFDILLVPGGMGTQPNVFPKAIEAWIKKQASGAKYVLSVCTGSQVLARAGVLEGKKATTNKHAFKLVAEETRDLNITWVAKARWVVDGNVWTSSGVTAGQDMAYAFLVNLVGAELANVIRGIVELGIHKEGDDEFAEFYNLV